MSSADRERMLPEITAEQTQTLAIEVFGKHLSTDISDIFAARKEEVF